MKSIILAGVDLISLGLLFWLAPFFIAKTIRKQMSGARFAYLRELGRQLPGAVTGAFVAVAAFYLFGTSYEEFAANSARSVGNKAMVMLSIDETSRCKVRLIEKYKLVAGPTITEASTADLPQTLSERDRIIAEVQMNLMVNSMPADEHLDAGLQRFCDRYGLDYPNLRPGVSRY